MREVVGADIDSAVLDNRELDRAVVIVDGVLPFPEGHFDLVLSDYVLEHVDDPVAFLREAHRVLKPGGRFVFRTPNLFHYVALISRMTPHWFYRLVANPARSLLGEAHAPWPTYYRLNTRRAICRAARSAGFSTVGIEMVEYEPFYLMFHAVPFLVGVAYERAVSGSEMLARPAGQYFRATRQVGLNIRSPPRSDARCPPGARGGGRRP